MVHLQHGSVQSETVLLDAASHLEQLLVRKAELVAVDAAHRVVSVGVQADVEAVLGEVHESRFVERSVDALEATPNRIPRFFVR